MIELLHSGATKENLCSLTKTRKDDEDNVAWVFRNQSKLRHQDGNGGQFWLLFVGGRDNQHFRLRTAQSHARDDLTPSHWSHVALLYELEEGNQDDMPLFEIALDPEVGFGFPPECNGVQVGRLSRYRNVKAFPNIGLASLPNPSESSAKEDIPASEKIRSGIEKFQKQRAVFDALELTVYWLSYLWGVGDTPNPLLQGHGIPSAAMAEVVLGATGFDLTPGLADRSSCPEAIWQSVKWWHLYHKSVAGRQPVGECHIEHRLP